VEPMKLWMVLLSLTACLGACNLIYPLNPRDDVATLDAAVSDAVRDAAGEFVDTGLDAPRDLGSMPFT